MGKDTGFLEYCRKDPGYRPKGDRLKDFKAVDIQADEEDIHEQAARCMDCGIPFCHMYGCPLSNIIPEFNDLVYRGQWQEALDILCSTNNFPEFTGRLCPATCETACVAGINVEPVTIRQIELAVIEKGFEKGLICPNPPGAYFDEKVAIVGSGPAGLAAADTLNKSGYHVTVFDDALHPGGILRYGIPDFKMEKKIVERRINLMKDEGVVFETDVCVGTDVSFRYLKKNFDAICLACGSRQPRDLPIPGRDFSGIVFAMDYLIQQNKRNSNEPDKQASSITASGKSVVVIGGGDTGSDCLGTALRQGAKNVFQLEIMPIPSIERPDSTPWPEWPMILRESHAHKEGGQRKWAVTTKAFMGEKGAVKKIVCAEVEWIKGTDNAMVPKEKPGTEFQVEADLVILAMGFVGPGNNPLIENFQLKLDKRGHINADRDLMTNMDGVFVAGDMTTGQSLVVRAIASGRQAAYHIDAYLQGKR
ncbi:MAG: glutamate synthase subunit beta [Desulfobacterales bacterium]|nr:glutamate synthase subunit beta [Desulfobacterales bacterium]MDX2510442.1 glutamate synthase subunit beta [Desulfobacterales bacterium]